jgi:hypothetical protein
MPEIESGPQIISWSVPVKENCSGALEGIDLTPGFE